MIRIIEIASATWTAISSAGQQGTAWVYKNQDGSGGVVISHSNTGSPPTNKSGFRIYRPNDNTNIAILGPDDDDDVFYARCLRRGESVKICVDLV